MMLSIVGLVFARLIQQLAAPPIVLRAHGREPVVEAVAVSPEAHAVIFWCEGLRMQAAQCFASEPPKPDTPLFSDGVLVDGDNNVATPFRGIRHFSFRGGGIRWRNDEPTFAIGCHSAAISAVCAQTGVHPTSLTGSVADPFETRATVLASTTVWNDTQSAHVTFRTPDGTIDVCCAGSESAYAATDLDETGDILLVYVAASGRGFELRGAILDAHRDVRREMVIARLVTPPRSIAAAATDRQIAIVWTGNGVFVASGKPQELATTKLSDVGFTPTVATDGRRVIAAWQERATVGDAVIVGEVTPAGATRSLMALRASPVLPFTSIRWSPKRGFVVSWRAASTSTDDLVVAQRDLPESQ